MIDVTCAKCGAIYHSENSNVGKQLRCTQCGSLVLITTPTQRSVYRSSAVPNIKSYTITPSMKRRLVYSLALVGIGTAVIFSVALLRRSNVPKQSRATAVAHQTESNGDQWQVVGEEPAPDPCDQTQPGQRPTDYHSFPTGTRVEDDVGTDGHGKLTVENGTSEDAVVRLFEATTDKTFRSFFVQAHGTAHKARIPEGTYRLSFTTGLNWIEREDCFSWQPSYFEFDRTFEYRENQDSEGVQYKTISVTLHPVPFGNVRTNAISRAEFLRGHRHVALQSDPELR